MCWILPNPGSTVNPSRHFRLDIKKCTFHSTSWTVYQRTLDGRTNNHAEASHRCLQELFSSEHPTFYEFSHVLHLAQHSRDAQLERYVAGADPDPRQNQYVQNDRVLVIILNNMEARTLLQLLRDAAYILINLKLLSSHRLVPPKVSVSSLCERSSLPFFLAVIQILPSLPINRFHISSFESLSELILKDSVREFPHISSVKDRENVRFVKRYRISMQ